MTTSFSRPVPYEVWRMPFECEDRPGQLKHRPVVVVDVDGDALLVLAVKVTGHGPRQGYPGEVHLADWAACGLSKPSCVRCSKAAVFDVAAFEGAERYGMLSPRDQRAVREGLLDAGVATL